MPLGFHTKHASRSSQYLDEALAQPQFEDSASPNSSPQRTPIHSTFPQEVQTTRNRSNTYDPQLYDNRLSTGSTDLSSHTSSSRFPHSSTYVDDRRTTVSGGIDNDSRQNFFDITESAQGQSTSGKKKTKLLDRISSKVKEVKGSYGEQQSSGIGGLGRRISKRTKDSRDSRQSLQQKSSFDTTHETDKGAVLNWRSNQVSSTSSPVRTRPDETEFDPYLIREGPDSFYQNQNLQRMVQQQPGTQQHSVQGQQTATVHTPVYSGELRGTHQKSQSQLSNNFPEVDVRRANVAELNLSKPLPSPAASIEAQYAQSAHPQGAPLPRNSSELDSMQQPEPQRPGLSARGQSYQSITRDGQMPYPQAGAQARRPTAMENKTENQGEPREAPPGYTQKHTSQNVSTSLSQAPSAASSQGSTSTARALHQSQLPKGAEQGRDTTPPVATPADRELSEQFKELSTKYKKVKGLYFEKTAQVEALQNTIANQRLSVSRTSLDDNEYISRFNRLDGAVKELAFSIRKNWHSIPPFLSPFVNVDAAKVGTKEMTAVGRAYISHFLASEIFHSTFHPGLDPDLSSNLKGIENTLRNNIPANCGKEEEESHTSKIIQWRLTTLEGLSSQLSTPEAHEHIAQFTQLCSTRLVASLILHLVDPDPSVESSTSMIVELAVSIATNLPLESRDIIISYPMPADPIGVNLKVEPALPALEKPGPPPADVEGPPEHRDSASSTKESPRKEKTRSGVFSGLMGGKKGSISEEKHAGRVAEILGRGEGEKRVRYAAFLGVEVRGRSVLVKAPVWTVA